MRKTKSTILEAVHDTAKGLHKAGVGSELYRWGKAGELQRYRCRQCNRTFNALTGTPLAYRLGYVIKTNSWNLNRP